MSSWQGKSKGTALGYKIFVAVLRRSGLNAAYFLLRVVALYYFLFSLESSKNSFSYFRRRIKLGFFKSLAKLYQNYYFFGQTLIDRVVIMAGLPNKFTFNFEGEQYLREMTLQQKGGLLLSAHLGNWEIAGQLFERLNTPVNIVMFDGEYKRIKDYLGKVTGPRKFNVIVIRNDLSHIYQINEAFLNNELVCMHADRFIKGNKTFSVKFLGETAMFPQGPFILAAKFKVPVSHVFAVKESRSHYHFFASKPKEYSASGKREILQDMAADFVTALENKVEKYPEQWYNYYDFWQH